MDILTDYREWREKQPERISTHGDRCHLWHEPCMIHRLAEEVERLREAISRADVDRSQPVDIATRLRQTRANMIGTEDEGHYFDCHKAAAEIERLRLTDEEREAIRFAAVFYAQGGRAADAATLRNLLERLT